MRKITIAVLVMLITACMVGPNYQEPHTTVARTWLSDDPNLRSSTPTNAHWWTSFHDPNLTALIQQGYQNNLSLQIAGVRILQARAQLAQSVGEFFPQQQFLMGNYTYNRIGGSSLQALLPQSFDTAALGFTANWELDFWGQYRRAIQANDATFLASIAAYDHALVTLTADIASTYIALRVNAALIRVTRANIGVQRTALTLAQARFNAGQTSALDVEQSKTELEETEATLPSLLSSQQRAFDLLAVLLGTTPDRVMPLLSGSYGIPRAPKQIAVGIPKEALANRSDVHQARLQAMAQSAAIGATKAELYPAFSLAGTFALSANTINGASLRDLFNWNNRTITAGPSFNWPILNYGQITNAVRMQDAAFQEALLNYMNIVLKAQQEVQDGITSYIETQKTQHHLRLANAAAIKTMQLSLTRYKEGESDYTPVLNAEQQQLRVQTALVRAEGEVPLALVAIYRALGGGWQIHQGSDRVSKQIQHDMATRTNWGTLLSSIQPQTQGRAP